MKMIPTKRGSQDHARLLRGSSAYDSGWPLPGFCLAKGSEVCELAQDQAPSDQLREASGVNILRLAEVIWCSPCVPAVWPQDQRDHRELGCSRESEDLGLHPSPTPYLDCVTLSKSPCSSSG